jgi:acyl carrier protein
LPEDVVDPTGLNAQIIALIAQEGMIDPEKIRPDATLQSLGVESVDVVMILLAIEEKFGVYVPVDGDIADSADLGTFVERVAIRIRHNQA